LNDPLIYARAIHYAATLSVAGVAFFIVFIAEPAFAAAGADARLPALLRPRVAVLAWTALLLTVLSGAAWLLVTAQSMSGGSWAEVFSEEIVWTVLAQTSFGRAWLERFVLACLLARMFVPFLAVHGVKSVAIKSTVVALAAGLVGALAWAGHAIGGTGIEGVIHPIADGLHLVAAAAWVGTLLPLALLLAAAGHDAASLAIARVATVRFSAFGIASVCALLVTGSINTWYLAGSISALTETDYGRLVLAKVALFLVMVAIAAVNRLHLTPRLMREASASGPAGALRQLRRNIAIEIALGAAVIAVVAVLGTNPPAFEALLHLHHSH
jgi:putative copper resistance protein D